MTSFRRSTCFSSCHNGRNLWAHIREALARGIRLIQTDSGGTVEHPVADRARLLAIGEGPERLRAEIESRSRCAGRFTPTRLRV